MTRQVAEAECEELRAEYRQFLAARPDVTMLELVHYTTLSDVAGRNFLNGHLPGGREVVSELRRVLQLARAGEILAPGGGNGSVVVAERGEAPVRRVARKRALYQTETVAKIAEVLDYCAEHCAIGVITANFGVGKTEGVRAWRQGAGRKVETLVFEFDEFSKSNKVDFAGCLAKMLGIEFTRGQQHGGSVFRAVCEALRERPCLLIFDQAETAHARVLQVVRQIWDRTHEYGVGVVLLAAPILATRMLGSRMADLGALTSRVGVWAPLTGVSRAEMMAIARNEGITEVDEGAFEMWVRATGGSMRRLMAAIDLLKAKHAGKRVTEKTIAGVAGHLWGMAIREA